MPAKQKVEKEKEDKKEQENKRHKGIDRKKIDRKKMLLWLGAAILIIFLMFFGTRIYLFFNYFIGNDIIIELDSEKDFISLKHKESSDVSFEVSVMTNPFCSARCRYDFKDLSSSKVIDNESMELNALVPVIREYTIRADSLGSGQRLYRFEAECQSKETFFCLTKEEPTYRSLILTVRYSPTEEELSLKNISRKRINLIKDSYQEILDTYAEARELAERINNTIYAHPEELDNLEDGILSLKKNMEDIHLTWDEQNYTRLYDQTSSALENSENILENLKDNKNNLTTKIKRYNSIVKDIEGTRDLYLSLRGLALENKTILKTINRSVSPFLRAADIVKTENTLDSKRSIVDDIQRKALALASQHLPYLERNLWEKKEKVNNTYEELCNLTNICPEYSPGRNSSLREVCEDIENLSVFYDSLLESNLTVNNTGEQDEIVSENAENETGISLNLSGIDMPGCELVNRSHYDIHKIENTNFSMIKVPEEDFDRSEHIADKLLLKLEFSEPEPECCLKGECYPCCVQEVCRDSEENYPLVFVHGHAISKETSAELSFSSIIKLQRRLEDKGFINAGAISVYDDSIVPRGMWGYFRDPVSIKLSYYYDFFRSEENLILVQQKSESIDTYAVRLKELIDIVMYRTDAKKVKIIGHSMGGLVVRRYMQIFGTENIDRVILVGTPNKGITGNIERLCPLTGGKRECRDMKEDSVFMKKLNSGPQPDIPVHVIIGTGCEMQGSEGDGVVLAENVELEWAENHHILGNCTDGLLHRDMLDPDKHPEVFSVMTGLMKP